MENGAKLADVGYLGELLQSHFWDGKTVLKHSWTKCIELKDYVENKSV